MITKSLWPTQVHLLRATFGTNWATLFQHLVRQQIGQNAKCFPSPKLFFAEAHLQLQPPSIFCASNFTFIKSFNYLIQRLDVLQYDTFIAAIPPTYLVHKANSFNNTQNNAFSKLIVEMYLGSDPVKKNTVQMYLCYACQWHSNWLSVFNNQSNS